MESKFFDADFYRAVNSDLSQFTDEQAAAHFQAYGLSEGRSFSPLIDLSYYRENNADLQSFDNAQLLGHLQQYGLNENRDFSVLVDVKFYRDVNSDLAQFNGADALDHLMNFGLNEGRTFSQYVDLGFYQEANSDLTQFTKAEALQHLVNYGLNEKRTFSSIVDLKFYEDFNQDLKELKFSGTQLLKHLDKYGIYEFREFSLSLDIDYYATENPDIATFYTESRNVSIDDIDDGDETETAKYLKFSFNHFIANGIGEGRKSSEEFDVNTYKSSNQDLQNFDNSGLYKHFQLYGINEERVFSDSYDAKYYKNNQGNKDSNLRELFTNYLIEGTEFAVENPKFEGEVVNELDLTEISLLGGSKDLTGRLSTESEVNIYRWNSYANSYRLSGIEPGQQVTLTMNAESQNFDTYLLVRNAFTWEPIIQNDNISETNKNSSLSFEVEEGIEYEVLASGFNSRNLGVYKLTAEVSAIAAETVKIGDSSNISLTRTSSFSNPARGGTYREDRKLDLTGVADEQVVKISMESSAFDPYLQLIDAQTGEVLAENDNAASGSNAAEILFTRENGVEYIVRFTSSNPDATGSFSYSVSKPSQQSGENPSISKDQTIWGIVNSDNDVDTYSLDTIDITAIGTKVKINLSSEDFDTRLTIKDSSSNETLFDNDDISEDNYNSQLELTIEEGVSYKIEVDSAFDDEFGGYDLTITPLGNSGGSTNNFGVTLQDTTLNNLLGNKTGLNRANILEFFETASKDGINTTEKADFRTILDKAKVLQLSDQIKFLTDKVVTGITDNMAAANFDNLVEQYFFGTKRPKANYVGKGDTARGIADDKEINYTYKTIFGDFFGSKPGDGRTPGEPRIRDINQSDFGNCVYIASLGALFPVPQRPGDVNKNSNFLNGFITSNGKETYNGEDYETWTFRFYNQSNPYYVTVDRQVITKDDLLQGSLRGGENPTRSLTDDKEAIWVPIAEKAYAQFKEEIDGGQSGDSGYTLTGNGDQVAGALEYITGQQPTQILNSSEKKNKSGTAMTFDALKAAVDAGKIITSAVYKDTDRLIGLHAFTFTSAYVSEDGEQRVVVRNPHGSDADSRYIRDDNPKDGFIDLSYEDFDNAEVDVAIFERPTSTKVAQLV